VSSDRLEPGVPAETDEQIWRECAERLRISESVESENRKRGMEAIRFRWGEQWPDDIKNDRLDRPTLTINHTNVHCQRQENMLRQQRPRIKVHPVGDGADIDTAKVVQGLIRHIENRSFASVAYDRGGKGAIDNGWGYWRIQSEYIDQKSFDQELCIKPIRNAFSVFDDPSAKFPDGRDRDWLILAEPMKREAYKRTYPKATNVNYTFDAAVGLDALLNTQWEGTEEVMLAEYYRIHEVADVLCLMNDGQKVFKSEIPRKMAKIRDAAGWLQATGEDDRPIERPTTRRIVQWFKLNGKQIVDRREFPFEHIPVVRCEGNVEEIAGRIVRKGMVTDLMDPARQYNYWRSSQTERYALAPKAPWVMAEGQDDGHPEWNDANKKSYSRLIYKPVAGPDGSTPLPPPQRQPPAPVEDGMASAAAGAEHDLMSVAGMPQENPEISARIVGGNKYLQRRQGMQDMAHYQYYDNQTLAIAWTGCLLLEMIPHYYDTARMQRIIGEDGVPKVVPINQPATEMTGESAIEKVKNDMTVGLYSVVMDTGPDYLTQRQEGAENMVEMLNTPLGEMMVQKGGDIVLRNMDFHGADQMADRIAADIPEAIEKAMEGMPEQAKNIIGALQQQLQQQQKVIEQQNLEIKYKQGVEQMRVHGRLEETDRKSETQIRVEDMKGATSRDVAEIGAAAQLLNTKAESDEAEKASQRLIKAGTEDRKAE